ncbi:unnamed protein product [Pleuronectes platessa]|uniref:Uncharacterized protein n=1 Tax=Pleuronectes platessa TaxID=8262 RepID=A0A9N7UHN5_PLEPL|nr:unnamed protein product [Pleuronectes platessa]
MEETIEEERGEAEIMLGGAERSEPFAFVFAALFKDGYHSPASYPSPITHFYHHPFIAPCPPSLPPPPPGLIPKLGAGADSLKTPVLSEESHGEPSSPPPPATVNLLLPSRSPGGAELAWTQNPSGSGDRPKLFVPGKMGQGESAVSPQAAPGAGSICPVLMEDVPSVEELILLGNLLPDHFHPTGPGCPQDEGTIKRGKDRVLVHGPWGTGGGTMGYWCRDHGVLVQGPVTHSSSFPPPLPPSSLHPPVPSVSDCMTLAVLDPEHGEGLHEYNIHHRRQGQLKTARQVRH